jgi:hypothetical protein
MTHQKLPASPPNIINIPDAFDHTRNQLSTACRIPAGM